MSTKSSVNKYAKYDTAEPISAEIVDSHCHIDTLDLKKYNGDMQGVMNTAKNLGVGRMLCVSITLNDWPKMMDVVAAHDHVYGSVGVHPNDIEGHDPSADELVAMATQTDKIIAIGETGLDYFRSEGDLEWQRDRFRRHIDAAKRSDLPLIIHTREAREDTLRILAEENAHECGGVMHCFAEDWQTAKTAMELGFYISFSGIVTFKNAVELKEVAKQVPLDRMLVETDSPYLAPVPLRGKANEPGYTRYVAEHIAQLRGVSVETIAAATTSNFERLFARVSATA